MQVKLLSGALGAEIKGVSLKDASEKNFEVINNLLLEHKVKSKLLITSKFFSEASLRLTPLISAPSAPDNSLTCIIQALG